MKKPKVGELTKEEQIANAQKVLQEEIQRKMQECAKEVEEVLKKHGFELRITQPQIILNPKN